MPFKVADEDVVALSVSEPARSWSEQLPFERSISAATVPMVRRRFGSSAVEVLPDKTSASAMKHPDIGHPDIGHNA